MKLTEIASDTEYSSDIIEFGNKLLKDCRPYLEEINYKIKTNSLFRGINKFNVNKLSTVRLDDRKPSNTPISMHNKINEIFTNNFGKAFRNALFVSSNLSMVEEYGPPYNIFPIGEIGFLWSPEISDLYIDLILPLENLDSTSRKDEATRIIQNLEDNDYAYKTTNLKEAIQSRHEIMIWVKSYYTSDVYNGINRSRLETYVMEHK